MTASDRLEIGEHGGVALVLDQSLEMNERVIERGRYPPAALPSIEQGTDSSMVGRISEVDVQPWARCASLDPKLDSSPQ